MLDTKLQESLANEIDKVSFPISIEKIDGIPVEMGKKLIRTDTKVPLGIIKSKYKPILHKDPFCGGLIEMKKGGLTLDNAEITIDSYENGAMAKMEVLLPEKQTKIGSHNLFLKYVARNSYNGRWKFQSFFGWLNQVCFNTLVTGQKISIYIK